MDTYNLIKKQILDLNQALLDIIEMACKVPGIDRRSFDVWQQTCHTIEQQIKDDIMRVAVVGAIKSGKSTFVNSLFKGDYLKRGAGVVTSIVTRIRQGDQLKATLFFKTWGEVNEEMEHAMVLFPSDANSNKKQTIDIRNREDREVLRTALSELKTEQLISQDTRSAASVLLSSYLSGYERVEGVLSEEPKALSFIGSDFESHREFVSDDTLSVYLNDVQLEIASDEFGQNLEISDCQGSDSPNPLHLVMIQDYLMTANLIIYVISSRTGIRQADIRFLSMIKKMGLIENTFFVINCDFSEHDTIDDLIQVLQKIAGEINLIVAAPEIYSFSSLYDLFKKQATGVSSKDGVRLQHWEEQPEFIEHHQKESRRFSRALKEKITTERANLLAHNHLVRLELISSGISQWVGFNRKMLEQDEESVNRVSRQMDQHKSRMERVKKMIRNTLNGAVAQKKKELRREIDRFFDTHSGTVLGSAIDYVRSYTFGERDITQNVASKGFASALFLLYQEFKQSVDLFMAESVNPEIVQLVRTLESGMVESLASVSEPFEAMVQDAFEKYQQTMLKMGIDFSQTQLPLASDIDLRAVKQSIALKVPTVQTAMQYSAGIKTEAVARLGYYTVVRLFKKIFRKRVMHAKEGELKALKVGARRMKHEMEKSMEATFRDYRENIKFQYFFKLADALADDFYDRLMDQFQSYVTDLAVVMGDFAEKRIDRTEMSTKLQQLQESVVVAGQKIGQIKGAFLRSSA